MSTETSWVRDVARRQRYGGRPVDGDLHDIKCALLLLNIHCFFKKHGVTLSAIASSTVNHY